MSRKNSPDSLTHWGFMQSSRAKSAGLKGTLSWISSLATSAKPQMPGFSSSSYLTINFPVGKAELFSAEVNESLFRTETAASPTSRVRNVVKKAITCKESNAVKQSGPNIITGTGNFPHYFALRPGLLSPASMGSSELQRALPQPHACSLRLGFANQCSGHPFATPSPSLSPHPLAVHHLSHGGSTAAPLPRFLLHSPLRSVLFTLTLYRSHHSQK